METFEKSKRKIRKIEPSITNNNFSKYNDL